MIVMGSRWERSVGLGLGRDGGFAIGGKAWTRKLILEV